MKNLKIILTIFGMILLAGGLTLAVSFSNLSLENDQKDALSSIGINDYSRVETSLGGGVVERCIEKYVDSEVPIGYQDDEGFVQEGTETRRKWILKPLGMNCFSSDNQTKRDDWEKVRVEKIADSIILRDSDSRGEPSKTTITITKGGAKI